MYGIIRPVNQAGNRKSRKPGGNMEKVKAFLKRKDIVFSAHRYGIDALGAMAQGLFASLLVGTILSTIGTRLNLPIFAKIGG